jgi:LytS/YehU family sensor histidine kinase
LSIALGTPAPPELFLSAPGTGAPARRPRQWRGALLIVGAWTVYGLVHGFYWWVTGDWATSHWPWVVGSALLMAWVWAGLTPLIFRLATQAAPSRIGWPGSILAHGAAFLSIALTMNALRLTLIVGVAAGTAGAPWATFTALLARQFSENFWSRQVFWIDVYLFTYLAVVLTGWAIATHRRYLDRTLRAHVLETQLARAQLHVLELQLQPHFLFNSLNAIQELAHESPTAAERMLRRLHALLAVSLERSGQDEVSLADELAALDPYIDIQRTRFEWLTVRVEADEAARAALVPHFILEPLVENAIRHGLAVRQGPGHIDVTARRVGDRLIIHVRDNGVGLSPRAPNPRPGIGLRNALERLRQLYGPDHRFELAEAAGGGVVVEIDVPFREAALSGSLAPWTHTTGSRETLSDIPVDQISAWRTGEFATAVVGPATSARVGSAADEPEPAPDARVAPPTRKRESAMPLIASVEDTRVPEPPLLTSRTWLALTGFWMAAAVWWTLQMNAYYHLLPDSADGTPGFWETGRLQLGGALYWLATSLGVLLLARRFRLGRRHLARNLSIHVVAALVTSFGFLWTLRAVQLSNAPILNVYNVNPLTGNFGLYLGLLAWSHARDFAAWYRAREITSARLTSQIARSHFHALCVQVRPQFVLGTLDLLARLVHVDVPRAERLIARLADVLRLTLDTARNQMTSLEQEMKLVAATVEAHRLGIRPSVHLETRVDPGALDTLVPSRLLATMVDDLLVAGADDPGAAVPPLTVEIAAERASDATRIRLHSETHWKSASGERHAWWRKKSAAEAAVADAGPLVTVAFPDRDTAVLIIADEPLSARAEPAAA